MDDELPDLYVPAEISVSTYGYTVVCILPSKLDAAQFSAWVLALGRLPEGMVLELHAAPKRKNPPSVAPRPSKKRKR